MSASAQCPQSTDIRVLIVRMSDDGDAIRNGIGFEKKAKGIPWQMVSFRVQSKSNSPLLLARQYVSGCGVESSIVFLMWYSCAWDSAAWSVTRHR